MWTRSLIAVAALTACFGIATDRAAARVFLEGLGDNVFVEGGTPEDRAHWLEESAAADANLLRITINWRDVAPDPPGNPTDPADPAYRGFEAADAAIRAAEANGQQVAILVTYAPAWAEGPGRPQDANGGVWKPDPEAFGDFATAVGRRYSGTFSTGGSVLPEVRHWLVWGEPNLVTNLAPLWSSGEGKPKPVAPELYRSLVNAFYEGVSESNPDAEVIAGGTSPFGDPPGAGRMRPLQFLREFLCLNRSLEGVKCDDPAQFTILAHNAITPGGPPTQSAIHRDDAMLGDFKNVVKIMRAAEREGTVGGPRKHALWSTEIWWGTSQNGLSFAKQARYLQDGMYSLFKQGAEAAIWFQIVDSATGPFQTGLITADGDRKPSFQAFRFPFVAEWKKRKGAAHVWVIAPESGTLSIEERKGSGWRTVKRLQVDDDVPKQANVKVGKKASLRATVSGEASLTDSAGN